MEAAYHGCFSAQESGLTINELDQKVLGLVEWFVVQLWAYTSLN
jgi:hypothetical protein